MAKNTGTLLVARMIALCSSAPICNLDGTVADFGLSNLWRSPGSLFPNLFYGSRLSDWYLCGLVVDLDFIRPTRRSLCLHAVHTPKPLRLYPAEESRAIGEGNRWRSLRSAGGWW